MRTPAASTVPVASLRRKGHEGEGGERSLTRNTRKQTQTDCVMTCGAGSIICEPRSGDRRLTAIRNAATSMST